MDVTQRVSDNLLLFGLNNDIKPAVMKHLAKVDEVLAVMVAAQEAAVQEIKNNKISINRVAKESGISRQTFYNNPVITEYIEKYLETYIGGNPYETIAALREELQRKDEEIAGLVQRDATVSKCKAENKALTDEIASLQATIRSQDEVIRKLRMEKNMWLVP